MKEDLRVSIVQSILHWEDADTNLKMFDAKLKDISSETDIIVLPEMFNSGFTMKAEKVAEEMSGKTVNWMREKAANIGAVITGSLVIKENDHYYNRLIWAQPDGIIFHYDKRHLFTMADEDKTYTAGHKKLIIEYKGWKICPLICFDLRFPVWIRNVEEYDVLIFVANWPEKRVQHWRKLLMARAIENQCYVVGVNRVGDDGAGFHYTGHSTVVDPMGENMVELHEEEKIKNVSLVHEEILKLRRYMQFLKERDDFKLL